MNIQETIINFEKRRALVELPAGSRLFGKPKYQENKLYIRYVSPTIEETDTDHYSFLFVSCFEELEDLGISNIKSKII